MFDTRKLWHFEGESEPANVRFVTVPVSPRFLKLTDVAEELSISMSQTYALVKSGDLPAIQVGGRNQWRVERVKLEEYIQRMYEQAVRNLDTLPPAPKGHGGN